MIYPVNMYALFGALAGILLLTVLIILIFCYCNGNFASKYKSKARMDGKTVIITGASSGIGKMTAFDLADRGARLILACRNVEKAKIVADEIRETTNNSNVIVQCLDTSKLSSTRSFSETILKTEQRIDVLILNAGTIGPTSYTTTEDDIELTMATNHFGHFLLINLLVGRMIESAPSRIILVTSRLHHLIPTMNPEKINLSKRDFRYRNPYAISKMCNIMCSVHLAPILQEHNVTINSMCPGMVRTEIFEKSNAWFTSRVVGFLSNFLARSLPQAIATLLYLAVDDKVQNDTGKFFVDYKPAHSSRLTRNINLVQKVWQKSMEVVNLSQLERSVIENITNS